MRRVARTALSRARIVTRVFLAVVGCSSVVAAAEVHWSGLEECRREVEVREQIEAMSQRSLASVTNNDFELTLERLPSGTFRLQLTSVSRANGAREVRAIEGSSCAEVTDAAAVAIALAIGAAPSAPVAPFAPNDEGAPAPPTPTVAPPRRDLALRRISSVDTVRWLVAAGVTFDSGAMPHPVPGGALSVALSWRALRGELEGGAFEHRAPQWSGRKLSAALRCAPGLRSAGRWHRDRPRLLGLRSRQTQRRRRRRRAPVLARNVVASAPARAGPRLAAHRQSLAFGKNRSCRPACSHSLRAGRSGAASPTRLAQPQSRLRPRAFALRLPRRNPATETSRSGDIRAEVTAPVIVPEPEPQPLEFDEVYRRHFGFVWRCLRALGVGAPQLDDAAQEVFIAVHGSLAGFRGDAELRTWLYGIVHNVAFKQRRTLARKGRAEPLLTEPMGSGPGPEEQAQDAEAAEFVIRFAATLDDKKRDVFVLALLEGLAIPEVAQILGVPLNTAYTRLRSVRMELREALQRHGARS